MATVIIGAGISGLLLAQALHESGQGPILIDKSRGVGGRMATKRVGEAVFDSGAQFFTVRDATFQAHTERWRQAGLVADWPDSPHRRLIGRPAMTAVPKALAVDLDLRREHRATAVRRLADGTWTITLADREPLAASRLILTCPVPQALALLDAGQTSLPADLRAALDRLTYHPCLALLVTLAGPSAVPPAGVAFGDGPVRWIADNTLKGVAPGVPAAVTIHAAAGFSAEHYAAPEADVTARLLAAVSDLLGAAAVTSTTLHRWKFSEPKATYPTPSLWRPDLQLGFAGDCFGGPKVEGAALSGLHLAASLASA
ncbi:protoporphyrinogen oxidase [Lacunisphaera limnophila]|uniref:Protoporphyrinogen oxidase n=1 Tax=Lacunisphaera limnophila TaxID=1838286 RepID=A0A1D8AYJ0_9BACT|nr:FAD-dependent oxidoreductase [Lacunisphaera limnophila]AOS45934.1 protoporphyrinogen oxidase [Lacunisphaera limnophila]